MPAIQQICQLLPVFFTWMEEVSVMRFVYFPGHRVPVAQTASPHAFAGGAIQKDEPERLRQFPSLLIPAADTFPASGLGLCT